MGTRPIKILAVGQPPARRGDSPTTFAHLSSRLCELDCEVDEAYFSEAEFPALLERQFDCILLDRISLHRILRSNESELSVANQERQALIYAVSHDLRQPLRSMMGFSQVLLDEHGQQIDTQGRHYLERVRAGAQRLAKMLEGLLALSRAGSHKFHRSEVRIDSMATRILNRLRQEHPNRPVQVQIEDQLAVAADPQLVESLLQQLLSNAWQFTAPRRDAQIAVGVLREDDETVYFVRDNGIGFKMDYHERVFTPFQRLHGDDEFSGVGIGLALAQRIVHRHGGRIWAQARPDEGATFYFTLEPHGCNAQ